MSIPATPLPLSDLVAPQDWLTLFDISLTGINLLRPLYAPDGHTIVDFAPEYLNPAGQRMTGLAEQPGGTLLGHFPHTLGQGIFAYYRSVFETGESRTYQANYQADGIDNYFKFCARRSGGRLLVSFTDTSEQDRSVVEKALRDSQAAEQAARAEAEVQRQRFYDLLMQLPAQVAVHEGPDQVFTLVNPGYQRLAPGRALQGQPIREAWPELVSQGILDVLDHVYQTGEPFIGKELPFQVDFTRTGRLEQAYLNAFFLPLRDAQGQVRGVLDFSYDVTEQVVAHQQVQNLNEELAAINEELRASNEEYQQANIALSEAQQQLRQFNQALEAARAEVERERGLLQALLTQAPVVIGLYAGEDLHVVAASTLLADLVGSTVAHVVGRPLLEGAPELRGQGFDDLLRQVMTTQVPFSGTEMLAVTQRAGAQYTGYYNSIYQPLYDADRQVIGVMSVAADVTEQVRARRQVEQLNQELETRVLQRTEEAHAARQLAEAQQQELAHLFMQAPVPIVILDGPDLVFQLVNPAYQRIFPGRALLGKPLLEALPELIGTPIPDLFQRVYQTGESITVQELPLLMARYEGSAPEEIYWTFTYQARYAPHGLIDGVRVFAHDITEQVRARQQVQVLNEELAVINEELAVINEELTATNEELGTSNHQLTRSNVDLDTFVYTASHDLKAPITNIEGLLDALRYELPAAVQQQEVINQLLNLMQGSVERFRLTINQLTDVSRLQHAQNQPAEQVGLAQVVEDVRLDLLPQLTSTHAELTVEVNPEFYVLFSPKNLRSVVYNLLSNAVKYRHPDRPPHVYLRAVRQGPQVVLTVQDNGLGLSEAQQRQLFGLFQRLHTHVEGTGVGLYMVKRMVENAGGTITVQSEVGVGSTFMVRLRA